MDNSKEVAEWFVYAERDKDAACYLQNMKPCPYEIICYHCQQSANLNSTQSEMVFGLVSLSY